MKRSIAVAMVLGLAAFASPFQANAQMMLGVGGGISVATYSGDDADDPFDSGNVDKGSRIGMSAGAFLSIPIAERFAIVPGAHFVQKGSEYSIADTTAAFKVNYIEIPLLVAVSLTGPDSGIGFSIFAGPTFAFEASCDLEITAGSVSGSESCDDAGSDERQTFDIGLAGGAGVSFPISESIAIMINAGYDLGLRTLDTSEPDPADLKNSAFFGGVSVGIPLG